MKKAIIAVLCALMAMPLCAQKKKDLVKQLQEVNAQVLILNQENSQLAEKIEALTTANTEQTLTVQELQSENAALCETNSELCKDIDAKTADIERLKKDNKKLKTQINNYDKYGYPYINDKKVAEVFKDCIEPDPYYKIIRGVDAAKFFDDLYKKSGSGLLITKATYKHTSAPDYELIYTFKYINNGKVGEVETVFVVDDSYNPNPYAGGT